MRNKNVQSSDFVKGHLKSKDNVEQLKHNIDYNAINLYISGSMSEQNKALPHPKIRQNLKIGYFIDMPNDEMIKVTNFMADCIGIQRANLIDLGNCSVENLSEDIDVIFGQVYFGYGYSRLRNYFHSNGKNKVFGFNCPEIDSLIDQLDTIASMKKRNEIGQEIISKLEDENIIILLAPCFEYVFSNLYIMPSTKLHYLTDFIINLPNMKVHRGKISL